MNAELAPSGLVPSVLPCAGLLSRAPSSSEMLLPDTGQFVLWSSAVDEDDDEEELAPQVPSMASIDIDSGEVGVRRVVDASGGWLVVPSWRCPHCPTLSTPALAPRSILAWLTG